MSENEIPVARLGIERHPTNPPMPIGIGVIVDGKIIALVTLEEFDEATKRLSDMRRERNDVGKQK